MAKAKAGPVVSDNGNFVIDAPFSRGLVKDSHSVCQVHPLHSPLLPCLTSKPRLPRVPGAAADKDKVADGRRRGWSILQCCAGGLLW